MTLLPFHFVTLSLGFFFHQFNHQETLLSRKSIANPQLQDESNDTVSSSTDEPIEFDESKPIVFHQSRSHLSFLAAPVSSFSIVTGAAPI